MRSSSPNSSFSTTARSLATPLSPPQDPPSHPSPLDTRTSWPRSTSTSTRLPQYSPARRSSSVSQPAGTSHPSSPIFTRDPSLPSLQRVASSSVFDEAGAQPWHTRIALRVTALGKAAWRIFLRLSLVQQILVGLVALGMAVGVVVMLVFGERIYSWLYGFAEKWTDVPGGWMVLWVFIVATAFPPMMGYSTAVTMCGFIYGMNGWFICSTANIIGSTASFVVFRRYLSNFSAKLAARDGRFAAFNLVLQRDGLPLLVAIRLCPLPYSLSNAGLSTLQPVRVVPFAIATALATPKLLIHVFVGDRLAAIVRGDQAGMDAGAKAVNYLGIAAGVLVGIGTGVIIYRRTVARARQLEAEMAAEEEEGLAGGYQEDVMFDGDGGDNELGAKPAKSAATPRAGLQHPDAFVDDDEDDAWGHNDADEEEQREERDEINFLELDGAKNGE